MRSNGAQARVGWLAAWLCATAALPLSAHATESDRLTPLPCPLVERFASLQPGSERVGGARLRGERLAEGPPAAEPVALPATHSAASPGTLAPALDRTALTHELRAALEAQAAAWNRGDVAGFMAGYIDDATARSCAGSTLTYTAGGVVVRGLVPLAERYTRRYGSSPETMGHLSFADLEVTPLGSDAALMVGAWKLDGPGERGMDGIFSLVWVRTKQGFRILHDHSSLRASRP